MVWICAEERHKKNNDVNHAVKLSELYTFMYFLILVRLTDRREEVAKQHKCSVLFHGNVSLLKEMQGSCNLS